MGNFLDLTGQRYGRLMVIRRRPSRRPGETLWECQCDCGKTTVTSTGSLRSGQCRSCGCLHIEAAREQGRKSATHRMTGGELYHVWGSMKTRCYNKRNRNYARWGARGITVCDEWRNDFKAFHDWGMANGYRKGLTLDRIDNDGPYSPENCRWATPTEQAHNTRGNRRITWLGRTKLFSEWSDELGIPRPTLCYRLRSLPLDVAFLAPVTRGGNAVKGVTMESMDYSMLNGKQLKWLAIWAGYMTFMSRPDAV